MFLIFNQNCTVSHLKERTEKKCLNCGADLIGRYCHVCGQENLEPKETVWHLVNHFFQDITHFDGKFFSSVKYLLLKPGFLSKEYMLGKRASYLNPIRMYVFTSAIFFIIFFSITNTKKLIEQNPKNQNALHEGVKEWEAKIAKLQNNLKTADEDDSVEAVEEINQLKTQILVAKKLYGDSSNRKFNTDELAKIMVAAKIDSSVYRYMPKQAKDELNKDLTKENSKKPGENQGVGIVVNKGKYETLEAYDSAQKKLPSDQRDGWFRSLYEKKRIELYVEYHNDGKKFKEHLLENFFHSFPKIFFISLPFFALILKMVYFRRKEFYYTSHGIFTIHFYCASFILMLLYIFTQRIDRLIPWQWLKIPFWVFEIVLLLYMFIYLYKAMRTFYGQGRFKTFVKFIIVNFFGFMITIILLALSIFISAISI